MRLISVLCLLAALACSACSKPWTYPGCYPGGVDGQGNVCNPENAKVGAFSHVPFDGIDSR